MGIELRFQANHMDAVAFSEPGGPEVLQPVRREVPRPSGTQVLIRVEYSGINRPDVFQRKGHYPAPVGVVQDIPGLEVSGEIVACGPRASYWKPGDRVCALLPGGGYAAYALAQEGHCLPLGGPGELTATGPGREAGSHGVDSQTGSGLPEALFTVWYNVFRLGRLQAGDTLLVHGGSGSIGTVAIRLATLLGAKVYATAGSADRARRCEDLGAIECIDYHHADFEQHWPDLQPDVILDSIGGSYFNKNLSILAEEGRLVHINSTAGRKVELDLLRLMQKRQLITGSTLRTRPDNFKTGLRDELLQSVWPLVQSGHLSPVIHRIYPFHQATAAHRSLESGEVFGKLLLRWD